MPDTVFDDYLDLVEAARELSIHPQSLRRLIKQKRIPATMFAGKYLIERDKLEIFKSSYDPRPRAQADPAPALRPRPRPARPAIGGRGEPLP